MNIFEYASKTKLRFVTPRGDVTVEQLWDMPLQARDLFDLDTVAKGVSKALKGFDEESFVKAKPTALLRRFEVSLEVVKHIIAYKLEQADQQVKRAARNEKRELLIAALADKEGEAIKGLTAEQIKAQLRELDEEVPGE